MDVGCIKKHLMAYLLKLFSKSYNKNLASELFVNLKNNNKIT